MTTEGVLICRVSDARQEQEGYSLEAQEDAGREYAKRQKIKLIQEPFVFQETASKRAERKKFRRVFDFIDGYKGKGPLAVLASRFSRLTRNSYDQAAIEELIDEGRVVLHLFREARVIDKHSSPGDRLATDVDAAVAKHKARETGRSAREGMIRRAQSGWYPHKAPPGYKHIEVVAGSIEAIEYDVGPSRRTRERIIVPDETTAPVVLRVFELRAEGYSLDAIRERVLEEGIIPASERGKFWKSKVEFILKHPFYDQRFVSGGVEYEGRHERIVPAELFEAVAATFSPARSGRGRRGGVLSGFIRCAECGCQILFEEKRKKNGRVYRYWRCSDGKRKHASKKYVSEAKLFEQFETALCALDITEAFGEAIAEELRRRHGKLVEDRKAAAEGFKRDLRKLDEKQDRLVDLLLEGRIDDDAYQAKKAQLQTDRDALTDKLTAAQNEMDGEYLNLAQRTIELARDLKSLWKAATPQERRDLLEKLVSNPVLDGVSLSFEWKKPFRLLGEMAKSKDWLALSDDYRTAIVEEMRAAA